MTIILDVNKREPESSKVRRAAEIIRKGGLVAFPTETVYGLGADAFNPRAVKKIYAAKERPMDNPLIVHVVDQAQLAEVVQEVPVQARRLIRKFWPGPLTLVLKRSARIPVVVSAGLDTVAVRMPQHRVALALIRAANTPIAAPSANRAGRPSPTMAEHVVQDLYGKIDVVLADGQAKVGLESTVLDLTTSIPTILRPGAVTLEQLRAVLGKVRLHPSIKGGAQEESAPKAPGMRYKHYAPNAELILVQGNRAEKKIHTLLALYKSEGKSVGVVSRNERFPADHVIIAGMNVSYFGRQLFKALRELDDKQVDVILVQGVPEAGLGLAVMNRLRRAASKLIKV